MRFLQRTTLTFLAFLLLAGTAARADVTYVINGIGGPLQDNVRAYVDVVQIGRRARASDRDLGRIRDNAIENARLALRPYGYYSPEIDGRFYRSDDDAPVVELSIRPGRAVRVASLELDVGGEGAENDGIRDWLSDWPLEEGSRLNQIVWKREKQAGIDIAREAGYLEAAYTEHVIELDLEQNTADVRLIMQTGPRYVVGNIELRQGAIDQEIVEKIPRFESGDPYSAELVDTLRTDLWRSGYYDDIEVTTRRNPEPDPPTVDVVADLVSETKNRYIGALGFGTDTGVRLQGSWTRQPVSRNGDRVEIGFGWQEITEEFSIRGNYRIPRSKYRMRFWTADVTIKTENRDLEFKRSDDDPGFIKIANGNIDERHLRVGPLRIFDRRERDNRTFVTSFVQYLNSERRYDLVDPPPVVDPASADAFEDVLRGTDNAFSLGIDYDEIDVHGSAFQTRGSRNRAWLYYSDTAFGSDVDFVQLYLSTRRSYVLGERFKIILRAETGYTDADVDDIRIEVGGDPFELSVTQLPNFYRFRAGGSASVRGYGFEELSNNNVGSNNVATASAEFEYRFSERWSAAVFADIGNAFNDWSDPNLKLGVGVGIRWYSIAGPIRIDVARAEDFDGKPWRLHFTIGTPLL